MEGSPSADKKQAPTPVRPQDPPTDIPEGLAAIKPEGPPAVMLECSPPTIKPEGPPPAVIPKCSPPAVNPECSLSVVNTEGHFTETTPMRELIKEMPGIVFPVDHLYDFDLLSTWALLLR